MPLPERSALPVLPRTHYLGVDVAAGLTVTHMVDTPPRAQHPHTVALRVWCDNGDDSDAGAKCARLTCIYR
jgi:hypothetical protein